MIGLGYVGLPTAVAFASKGVDVIGVDIDPRKVEMINRGESYITEPGIDDLLKQAVSINRLTAITNGAKAIEESDAVIIAVNTPLSKSKNVDFSQLDSALSQVKQGLHHGLLVIVESTLPPGTTRDYIKPFLENSGLSIGEDLFLAHVPERIAPGKALEELFKAPRVVGGVDQPSTKRALELYSNINNNLIPTDATTAEFVKLIENTFRDLNIAYANLLALMSEKLGIDVYEAISLANTHPRVNIHLPGAGVGGPCLTKDPYFLTSRFKDLYGVDLIEKGRMINEYMPKHVVEIILDIIDRHGWNPKEIKVTILGTAYKAGVNDTRESPGGKIISMLMHKGFHVIAYDPYAEDVFSAVRAKSIEEAVEGADIVVVATDHKEFKEADWISLSKLMRHKIIVDGRRVLPPIEAVRLGLEYYGVGYGKRE